MNAVYQRLLKQKESQEKLALAYEKITSYEMAYISLWIILEKTLKDIDTKLKRDKLYSQVSEWKQYLEIKSNDSKKPKEIRSFNLKESERIPELGNIEEYLGNIPITKEIMNTQTKHGSTKWRDKRNNIAHKAESFGKKETYCIYRDKILGGVNEVAKLLAEAGPNE